MNMTEEILKDLIIKRDKAKVKYQRLQRRVNAARVDHSNQKKNDILLKKRRIQHKKIVEKAEKRLSKMRLAKNLRDSGMSFRDIAKMMEITQRGARYYHEENERMISRGYDISTVGKYLESIEEENKIAELTN